MHEQDFKNILDGFINISAQRSVILQVLKIIRKVTEGRTKTQNIVKLHGVPLYWILGLPILKGQWKTEQ